jgi:hypothetical protein
MDADPEERGGGMSKTKILEAGNWRSKDHYSLIGSPQSFYFYIKNKRPFYSKWVSGKEAFRVWFEMKHILKKSKKEFIRKVIEGFEKYHKNKD